MSNPAGPIGTIAQYAAYSGHSARTLRFWATKGFFTLYRVKGVKGVVLSFPEADRAIERLTEQGLIRPQYAQFGGAPVIELDPVVRP